MAKSGSQKIHTRLQACGDGSQFRHVWNERWVSNSAEYASSPGPVNSGTIGFCSSKEIDGNASTGSSAIHIQNEVPPRIPPQQPRLVFRSPLLPPATPIDTPQTMFTPAMSHDGSTMQQNNIMGGVAPQPHPYPTGNDMDTVASNGTVWHGNIGPVAMAHVPQPQPLAPPASVATYGATAIPSYPPNHEFNAPPTSRGPHIPYNGRAPRDNIRHAPYPARTHATSNAHRQYTARAYPPIQEGYELPSYSIATPYAAPMYSKGSALYKQTYTHTGAAQGPTYNAYLLHVSGISGGVGGLPVQQDFALETAPSPKTNPVIPLPPVSATSPLYDMVDQTLDESLGTGLYRNQDIGTSMPGPSANAQASWGEASLRCTTSTTLDGSHWQRNMDPMGGLLLPQGDFTAVPCFAGTYEPTGGVELQLGTNVGTDSWWDGASSHDAMPMAHLGGIPSKDTATLGCNERYEGAPSEQGTSGSPLQYNGPCSDDW